MCHKFRVIKGDVVEKRRSGFVIPLLGKDSTTHGGVSPVSVFYT